MAGFLFAVVGDKGTRVVASAETAPSVASAPSAPRAPSMEGKRTPWGVCEYSTAKADGIVEVGTAGHGGIHLDRKRNAAVHPAWRRAGGWYEEDCEFSIAVLTHPGAFSEETIRAAHAAAMDYYPDAYALVTGREVPVESSRVLRERRDREVYADRWIATVAWGDWYDGAPVKLRGEYVKLGPVPAGHVGVLAVRGRDVDASRRYGFTGEVRALLVTAEGYRDASLRTSLGMVVSGSAEEWLPAAPSPSPSVAAEIEAQAFAGVDAPEIDARAYDGVEIGGAS